MGSVVKLAEAVKKGLEEALPKLRKTVVGKLSLAIGAMLETRTANTAAISNVLPLATERADMREQWLRRLLSNELLDCVTVMEPFAREVLQEAGANGKTILLSMDQTELGKRFAILVISVRAGDRSLPLAWHVEAGEANIGFAGQKILLDQVRAWLPAGASVMLLADRFYPSESLFSWLHEHQWQYRLRLKGNLLVDVGCRDVSTTGQLAEGAQERYEPDARLFASGAPTSIGVLHEAGHKEPWIIAMDCLPTEAAVRDYGSRWAIEPMFSDFKTRGFGLEDTHLEAPDRLARLMLIMALAMYWCVKVGQADALDNPTPTEKKPVNRLIPIIGASGRLIAACSHGSNGDCVYC
jgi:hypothetical protein